MEELRRNCFLPPIPELEEVAGILGNAADAILGGDLTEAKRLLIAANNPVIFNFAQQIMGPTNPSIHGSPPRRPATQAVSGIRMPQPRVQREIFQRDGWRCRFCGCRVVWAAARTVIGRVLPGTIPWPSTNVGRHSAFFALEASLDHIVPHSRGGNNDPFNLVAACQPCQFGRNDWTLEEVGLLDPWERPPIIDRWDGLTRLEPLLRP
jgi:5-methylcytosine-specific restriction endonuclease McrA